MLPKNKDKSARKPALQMFKYISPNQPLAMRSHCGSNTRVHTRSMVELEPNTSAQQLPVSSKGNHLSSIHSSHEPTD